MFCGDFYVIVSSAFEFLLCYLLGMDIILSFGVNYIEISWPHTFVNPPVYKNK